MILPSLTTILTTLLIGIAIILAIIWWQRISSRGLDWIIAAIPLAFAVSYLSSIIFQTPDYQAGCDAFCPGWRGYPLPTHLNDGAGAPDFLPAGFIANAASYYAAILIFSAFITLLARRWHWEERRRRWRIVFALVIVLLPLALTPIFFPPRQPQFPNAEMRLVINAERAWRWQLGERRFSQRRLVAEDVRPHPDGERQRVCFRAYTWFYLPSGKIYVDLEPAGVLATGGGRIPLDASCWVQP